MNIKEFTFPIFDKWIELKNYEYKTKQGVYYVEVRIFSWGKDEYEVIMALSTDNNPLNIYAHKLFERRININSKKTTKEEIKRWYNKSIYELNEWWKDYILETYLEED